MRNASLFIALVSGLSLSTSLSWFLGGYPDQVSAASSTTAEKMRTNVITVCQSGNCDYADIHEGGAAAENGDVVKVAPGT